MAWRILLFLLLAVPAFAQQQEQPAPGTPAARQAQFDELMNALKAAGSETEAGEIETRLRQMLLKAGSPAVTLLMARGLRDLLAGANAEAEADFDDALTLDPDLVAGYDQRAEARLRQNNLPGTAADVEAALKREPRDLFALQNVEKLAEARHDWNTALAAWQRLLALDPRMPGGQAKLKDLRRRALGENA